MESEDPSSRETTLERLEHLFGRIRAGDEGAIAAFFEIANHRIRFVAQRILRGRSTTPHGATDDIVSLTAEALLAEFRRGLADRFDDPRRLMGYLATIIRHKAIDVARQGAGVKHRTQYPARPLPPEAVGEVGSRITFHEMIEGLPDRQREIVDLRIMCDCTYPEIARLLGIGVTTAHDEYNRALRQLSREFGGSLHESKPALPDDPGGDSR